MNYWGNINKKVINLSKKIIKIRLINFIMVLILIIAIIIGAVLIVKNINKKNNEEEANKIASFDVLCNKFV